MIEEISVDRIDPSPFQSRKSMEPLESSGRLGVLQPLLVRAKEGGRFELVAGHRRLASLKAMGETVALCKIMDLDDEKAAVAIFAENHDRKDLTDFEMGEYFMTFMRLFRLTTREAGERLGVDHATIVRCIGIVTSLQLVKGFTRVEPEAYRQVITESKFIEANKLPEEKKVEALGQIVEHELTTSETKAFVRMIEAEKAAPSAANEILLERETRKPESYSLRKSGLTKARCCVCGESIIMAHQNGCHVLRDEEK